MKKKLSLIIPLLAIFCLISGGYALLSNNMIADDNSNYESPALINESIPDASIAKTNIAEKNVEDNILITQETTKQKTSTPTTNNNTQESEPYYTCKSVCFTCGEEIELMYPIPKSTDSDCTGYISPGQTDHMCIPDSILARIDPEIFHARSDHKMTPEQHQKYLEINSKYIESFKNTDNSQSMPNNNAQPETSTHNNNQEINNHDVNNQMPNNNAQPEIPTHNNNQKPGIAIIEYDVY